VKKTTTKKKVVASTGAKAGSKGAKSPLFEKNPRNFRIGGDIQPKRDLTRFVRWPKYIRIQRQKRILLQRLKVPPALHQFSMTIDRNQGKILLSFSYPTILIINICLASQLLKLLAKYKPENKKDKKVRLQKEAEAKKAGGDAKKSAKPYVLKFGLNHVTTLVEEGKAKLVVIAHDVDPIELMAFLPALCRKKGVAYCFIKGKARLGQLVHQKTATCVAVTDVRKEDYQDLETLTKNFRAAFNDNDQLRRNWSTGVMGIKNQHMMAQRERLREIELQKKANM
jgi:large subunit ribosomal protein L7Ae